MNRIVLFSCFILLFSCQRKTVLPLKLAFINEGNVLIHNAEGVVGPCEPSICIDPSDNNRIVSGSILDNLYISEDQGETWERKKLTSPYGVYGDPVIRISDQGTIYYAHLSNPTGRAYTDPEFLDRIVVQTSKDQGKSWNDGGFPDIRGEKDQDKQWMYIDPASGKVIMTWTEFDKYGSKDPEDKSRILFSQSTDDGITWTSPISISSKEGDCIDSDLTTEGAVPAIDLDGNYHVVWSYDGKLYHNQSSDRGVTWMKEEKAIADHVGGWDHRIPGLMRANGMPILGIDNSPGPHRGRLYVNWTDQRNGVDDTDVWIISSDDQGKSWSSPKKVNDDNSMRHQFFTWMDIDPVTGYIYTVFYDRRETEKNFTDVYLAYSTDGGETFINKKISESSFNPNPFIFFGDYNDISAHDGIIRPIWTRFEDNKLSVWTSLISMK